MERLIASSDDWLDITAEGPDGLQLTYPIGLEVTYDFDPKEKRMNVSLRALPPGGESQDSTAWKAVCFSTREAQLVSVFVGAHATASRLVADLGLPPICAFQVREHLEKMASHLNPFVLDVFLGRTLQPELHAEPESEPQGPETVALAPVRVQVPARPDDNILVSVDRDVSRIFGEKEGSCTLEYTLFSEPKAFRAVVIAKRNQKTKRIEFLKKDPFSVIRYFNEDSLAFELSSFFGRY